MRNIIFLSLLTFVFVLPTIIKAESRRIEMPLRAMIYAGQGISERSVSEIGNILSETGVSSIMTKDVSAALSGPIPVDLLIFPGGWAPDYKEIITKESIAAIQKFVDGGGACVGICAGAYFAAEKVLWEEKEYTYPLGLFKGKAVGPIFPNWEEERLIPIRINDETLLVSYVGGPFFLPGNNSHVVLAEYIGGKADKKPAALLMTYGAGRVFLCGPHLEFSDKTARNWFKKILRLLVNGRY